MVSICRTLSQHQLPVAMTHIFSFLQLKALILLMSHLALAIITPFSFGTVPSATVTNSAAAVCPSFDLLYEAIIGVGEAGNSFGQGKVSLAKVPQVILLCSLRLPLLRGCQSIP